MLLSSISPTLEKRLTIRQAKQIHAILLASGLNHLEPLLVRQIIVSAGSYHSVNRYVKLILHGMRQPEVSPLAYTIRFLCQSGQFQDAANLYVELQHVGICPNTFAISSTLKACGKIRSRTFGITIHAQAHKYGFSKVVYVQTALMDFYSKIGDIKTAHRVFDDMSEKNIVSWNSILSSYVKFGDLPMAQSVFDEMPEKDIISWNSMVSGYGKIGDMEQAYALFRQMPQRNTASWNSMIGGYIDCGKIELARGFFEAMPERSSVSFITMISGYSRCGDVGSAEEIFYKVQEKDQLLYNAMISCYAQNGRPREALHLFDEMLKPNINICPDKMTLASAISACSQLGDSKTCSRIEAYMGEVGIRMDDHLATALIDLHAKCGSIDKAFELFHRLQKKDLVAYTAMILGCGINGRGNDGIKLFEEMMDSMITPNIVTITGALTAYNHAGLVEEGYRCFNLMQKYDLVPSVDHYAIMVDLLGKAGRLEEAYNLIQKMPMQPHSGVWGALLLACSLHNNLELGEIAGKKCFELEPNSTGYYSLLANIYASAGRWDDAKRLRDAVGESSFSKVPGSSWMEHSKT